MSRCTLPCRTPVLRAASSTAERDKARTWLDLTRAVFAAMGREPKIEFIEMPKELQGKYQYFTEAKTEKLRAAGYTRQFTSLEDGVREYVQAYLENQPA